MKKKYFASLITILATLALALSLTPAAHGAIVGNQVFQNGMLSSNVLRTSATGNHNGAGAKLNYSNNALYWAKVQIGIYGATSGYRYSGMDVGGGPYSGYDLPTYQAATRVQCIWHSNLGKNFDSQLQCNRYYK